MTKTFLERISQTVGVRGFSPAVSGRPEGLHYILKCALGKGGTIKGDAASLKSDVSSVPQLSRSTE